MAKVIRPMVSATKKRSPYAKVDPDDATDNSRWGTPREFYSWRDHELGFTIDTCADVGNKKHGRYYDAERNGLIQSWADETAWCNMPYNAVGDWLLKCRDEAMFEGAISEALIPCRPDTQWWRNLVLCKDGEAGKLRRDRFVHETTVQWLRFDLCTVYVYTHDQRLQFEGADDPAPFASTIVGYVSHQRKLRRSAPFEGRRRMFNSLFAGALT